MKKKIFLLVVVAVSLSLFQAHTLFAAGIGINGSFGGGQSTLQNNVSKVISFGGGLVFDTNLSKNALFNYRLNVDFLANHDDGDIPFFRWIINQKEPFEVSYNLETRHSFGFGIVRRNGIRLWAGPQIAIGAIIPPPSLENKMKGVYGGGGVIIGLNINPGDLFTLSLTGAVRAEGLYKVYDHGFGYFDYSEYAVSTYRVKGEFNCSFIFRFNNDRYEKTE